MPESFVVRAWRIDWWWHHKGCVGLLNDIAIPFVSKNWQSRNWVSNVDSTLRWHHPVTIHLLLLHGWRVCFKNMLMFTVIWLHSFGLPIVHCPFNIQRAGFLQKRKKFDTEFGEYLLGHIYFPCKGFPATPRISFPGSTKTAFDVSCVFLHAGGEPIEILNMDGWRFLKKDWPYIWFDIRDDWSKTCTPTLAHGDPVEFSKAFWCLQCILRRAAATPVKKKPGVPGVPIHP